MVLVKSYFKSYRRRNCKHGSEKSAISPRIQHQSSADHVLYICSVASRRRCGGPFVFVARTSVLNVRPAPFFQPCFQRTGSKRFVRTDDAVRPTDKRCPKREKNTSPRPTARKIQLRHSSLTPFDGRRFVSSRFRRNNFIAPIPKLQRKLLNLVKLSS